MGIESSPARDVFRHDEERPRADVPRPYTPAELAERRHWFTEDVSAVRRLLATVDERDRELREAQADADRLYDALDGLVEAVYDPAPPPANIRKALRLHSAALAARVPLTPKTEDK